MDHVFAEVQFVLQNVINQATEEQNVGARAQRNPGVRDGGCAAEARVHVDQVRAVMFLGLDHPLESDGMISGHVRSHNKDDVRVHQVTRCRSCSAPAVGGTQTGHRRAMSYSGLIADAHHAEASGEHLFNQVIFFVVERSTTQMSDGFVLHQALAVLRFSEILVPTFPQAVGDHVHRCFEVQVFPLRGLRPAVLHFREAFGVRGKFEAV